MSECNGNNNCNAFIPFRKNHYFYNKLLGTRDFKAEQDYVNGKRHLLNRLIPGLGIARGLDAEGITIREKNGEIEIEFKTGGTAIDGCGREIIVPTGTTMAILKEEGGDNPSLSKEEIATHPYLYLNYKEQFTEYVPAVTGPSCCDEQCCPNRVLETFEVIASTEAPSETGAIPCPDLTCPPGTSTVKDAIQKWVDRKLSGKNGPSGDRKVFLAEVKADLSINKKKTQQHRTYVYNNKLLWELLYCFITTDSTPTQTGGGQYHVEKIVFTKKGQVEKVDHGFLRFPCADVYQKVSETTGHDVIDTSDITKIEEVFFFLRETQSAEVAEMFGQKVEDLEKWAISLEEFKKKYDKKIGEKDVKRDINVRPSDSFPHFFNKLKDLNRDYFKVGATVSLRNITDRPINAFYDQIYCVFTKEGKETKRNVWKKNPGSVDITMNKKSARVTCRMEKGGTVIVVLTA